MSRETAPTRTARPEVQRSGLTRWTYGQAGPGGPESGLELSLLIQASSPRGSCWPLHNKSKIIYNAN